MKNAAKGDISSALQTAINHWHFECTRHPRKGHPQGSAVSCKRLKTLQWGIAQSMGVLGWESLFYKPCTRNACDKRRKRKREGSLVDLVNPCHSFFLFDLSPSLTFTFAEKQKFEGGQYLTVTKEQLIQIPQFNLGISLNRVDTRASQKKRKGWKRGKERMKRKRKVNRGAHGNTKAKALFCHASLINNLIHSFIPSIQFFIPFLVTTLWKPHAKRDLNSSTSTPWTETS